MMLTFNGKTQSPSQWSREVGIDINTIISRKRRNWSDERALTEELLTNDNKITKNDAELWLNENFKETKEKPDIDLLKLASARSKKPGQFIRKYSPKAFDVWYDNHFKPRKENELRSQKNPDIQKVY